ncbi:Peroxidase like protein [Argiope bruennichi]|uniref:Peroxidase like protein n=1 Tax=Argiope bruennichi TaxID=94029 RepID=A0A8T0G1P3_ARGBR|nr:Peroxidase like protein [Argiope bruennichi]
MYDALVSGASSVPVLPPYVGSQRDEDIQTVYGPQLKRECRMKYEILDPRNIDGTRQEITKCSDQYVHCYYAEYSKYRTIDGTCNNLKNPSWGKSDNCLRRVLPFDYADKIAFPRESCTGNPLPNPRLVSNVFHKEIRPKPDHLTTHFMEWGQMLAHDLSLNDIFRDYSYGTHEAIQCCNPGPHYSDKCMSIPVPPKDPFYPKFGQTCINFVRTVPCKHCSSGQRVHWNQNTAYHDLSLVYGSTEDEAQKLRSGIKGMLDIEYNPKSGPMPPTVPVEELCISPDREKSCYKTGDQRANQNPFLLTVHTYLLRHHNFICQELSEVNPHWDDEKLYQEARRLNIAIAQYITYGHYLPNVLGEIMKKEGIQILPGAQYTKYDPELDASIADEYTTFAARYGHTLIPGRITEIDPKTEEKDDIWLRDYYYTPFGFRYGQFDKIAKGMTVNRKMKHDVFLSDDVRNYLYRRLYLNQSTGLDLAAASIVRGRDHGIPAYTYYLNYLFNITIYSFNDLRKLLPPKSVDLLEELYESPHDIDTYSAGLAEYYVPGGFVGPTFGAILGQQYKRIKFGDRYWFEHGNQAGSFTPEQLLEIKRTTLARILCETTRIRKIQMQPFRPPSSENPVVPCEEIHRFDFYLWKE